jgi:DNA-binding HxlR family transcriptional regulator
MRVGDVVVRQHRVNSGTLTPTVPVTVTYELTELGLSLQDLMRGVKE